MARAAGIQSAGGIVQLREEWSWQLWRVYLCLRITADLGDLDPKDLEKRFRCQSGPCPKCPVRSCPEVSPIPEVVAALLPREKLIWAKASDILESPLSAEEMAMLDALKDRPINSKVSQRFGEGYSTRAKAIWGP